LATIVVIFMAGSALAQQSGEELIDQLTSELDQLSQDVAEEYLTILENLTDVLDDYADYVSDMPSDAAEHDVKIINVIQENLKRNAYVDNPQKLLDDLYKAIDGIKAVENEHRVKFNTNSPKCCRLGRSLRKELVINAELVEDYLDKQTTQVLNKDEIQKYVNEALKALRELDLAKGEQGRKKDEIRKAIEALKALGLEGRIDFNLQDFEMPEIPEMPKISPMPEVPNTPAIPQLPPIGRTGQLNLGTSKEGSQNQSEGLVQVTRTDWPIVIENPSGDIIVTGTTGKTVRVKLSLRVTSSSLAKENEFLEQASLIIASEEGQYTVKADLPRLSDHRTELLESKLEVLVPRSNKVECTGAFGTIRISDVDGGVSVDADKTGVEIFRIKGGATVRDAMGSVTAEGVLGDIDIETSYSPIELTRCQGQTRLENQYSSISMTGCEINNTGQIDINSHNGNVTIENSYGQVEINRLTGDLEATNGYQPLIVTNVTGSARLENTYAEISVEDIGARLSASNNAGPIFVETTAGPVELDNSYGNISISLGRNFVGGSTITSTGGSIEIAVIQRPDLVLSLHTIGGSITSNLPLSVKTRGDSKTAELVLGDGGESLDVSGNGSAIVIQGR
jgi:hypothetical protein